MYSPKTNKFIMLAPMEIARYEFACCRVEKLLYVIGGQIEGRSKSTNLVEAYDFENNTWTDDAELPEVCSYLTDCVVNKTFNKL